MGSSESDGNISSEEEEISDIGSRWNAIKKSLVEHSRVVLSMIYLEKHKILVSTSWGRNLRFWNLRDIENARCVKVLSEPRSSYHLVPYDGDDLFLGCTSGGEINVFSVTSMSKVQNLFQQETDDFFPRIDDMGLLRMIFISEDEVFCLAEKDAGLIINIRTGNLVTNLTERDPDNKFGLPVPSKKYEKTIYDGHDKKIRKVRLSDGSVQFIISLNRVRRFHVDFNPRIHEKEFLWVAHDEISCYETEEGTCIRKLDITTEARHIFLYQDTIHDNKFVFFACDDGLLSCYDLKKFGTAPPREIFVDRKIGKDETHIILLLNVDHEKRTLRYAVTIQNRIRIMELENILELGIGHKDENERLSYLLDEASFEEVMPQTQPFKIKLSKASDLVFMYKSFLCL